MICPTCGTRCSELDHSCAACGHQFVQAGADDGTLPPPPTPESPDGGATVAPTLGTPAHEAATVGQDMPPTMLPTSDGLGHTSRPTQLPEPQPTASPFSTGVVGTGSRRGLGIGGGPLQMGPFGTRYHIIKMLGAGGMGAVYHAWDEELGVAVALKVIRPEHLADPAAAAELERRFKRELVLARQITHPNVVRIHDLGEVEGIKYLTMPFIHGEDLASVLKREGKLPVPRALRTARQILEGLGAAHRAGVVHRDLKPANVMIDAEHQACIMDFGIARSSSAPSATAAGAVVGTVAYMAPEQARGEVVDQRADVYSFGLILRDMLVGVRPSSMGDSALSELMTRMAAAPSVKAIDSTLSDDLERIVKRCLEPQAEQRYPNAATVLHDLEQLDDDGRVRTAVVPPAPAPRSRRTLALWAAGIAAVVLLGVGVWFARPAPETPAATVAPEALTIAILPFRNASGDPTLDGLGTSIGEVLRGDLGASSYVQTATAGRVQQTLRDLRIGDSDVLNDTMLRRLADLTNAQAIVWGQFVKIGNQIQLIASMQDVRRGDATQTLTATAASTDALLPAIAQLADQIRQHVSQAPNVLEALRTSSLKPTTQSFAALHEYNVGVELARGGSHAEAITHFTNATQEDQEFGLAYARLAQSYSALGYDEDAERAARRAGSIADRVTPYERYLIEATQARVLNDTPKAIAALESVAKVSPNDTDVLFELGRLYEGSGNFGQARDVYAKLIERDPKWVDALLANGRVLIQLQQPNESLDFLTRALSLSIELDNENARSDVLQALGIAYKQLNRLTEALRHYQQALEIRRKLERKTAIAASLNEIGQIQSRMGESDAAFRSYDEALRIRREIKDRRGIGTVLINMGSLHADRGQSDAALNAYREALQIQREVGNPALEALCLNGIGSAYVSKGQYDDAVTNYERALALREKLDQPRDIADTLHNLAEAAIGLGQFDQALTHYLRALELRRKTDDARGVAVESFSTGTVFDWQGRLGAAVKARQEAYDVFRRLKDRSYLYGSILIGYGGSLSRSGQTIEAEPVLTEALAVARELKNPTLIAQALAAEGERLLFTGDVNGARTKLDEALVEANKTSDRQAILGVRLIAEKAAAAGAPNPSRAARFAALASDADAAGLKHVAVEATILRAEGLIQAKQYAVAQRELERALGRSESLNLRVLQAKTHALLADVLTATNEAAEARRHRLQSRRLFEELRQETGSDRVLARSDLAAAYKSVQQ